MKIAMISEGWHPVFGGGQVHVQFLCEGLVRQYVCKVDLFTRALVDNNGRKFNRDENLMGGSWRIIRTGRSAMFFNSLARVVWLFVFTCYFVRKAKKERYDIIHAHALLAGLPAKIAGAIRNIPVVFTVHGTMHLDVPKKTINYYLERFFVTHICYDLEISVSHKLLHYSNTNKNIQVIYNGVDILKYDSIDVSAKYEGLNGLTVARIDWQKNHRAFLEAINEIDRSLLDSVGFCRNIVGDGPLLKELQSCIQEYNLGSYVKYKGKVFGDDLIREYKKNHFFVLPSLSEGQPLTILEAFASKLPVLATQVGDNDAFVFSGKNGILVPPGDKKLLKQALLSIITMDRASIVAMGEVGYDYVKQYDWSVVVDKTMEAYKTLLP